MSFPTSQWGPLDLVYSTVPGPSPSSPGSADGPVLGNHVILADGSTAQFVQFVATTAANKAVTFSDWEDEFEVTPTTATNQLVYGVNDLSLQSITADYCGWMTTGGLMFPLCLAATAAEAFVCSTATSGTLGTVTLATDTEADLQNQVLVGGVAAASPVYRSR